MLTEVHFGEQIERSRGDIVICYPAPDDTLWSVAGRYRTKLSDLVDANQLSQAASPDSRQSLEGVQYLIV